MHIDVSGNCLQPLSVQKIDKHGPDPGPFKLLTPCKQCAQCMSKRWNEYINRIGYETLSSDHTVFFTGTLAPSKLKQLREQATQDAHKRQKQAKAKYDKQLQEYLDKPEETPPPVNNFDYDKYLKKRRTALLTKENQRYLKRLRENTGAKIKYIAIIEIGNGKTIAGKPSQRSKEGNPHTHMLLHFKGKRPKIATIKDTWTNVNKGHKDYQFTGWATANVISNKDKTQQKYIAKYIGKQSKIDYGDYKAARPATSINYGEHWKCYRINYFLEKAGYEPIPIQDLINEATIRAKVAIETSNAYNDPQIRLSFIARHKAGMNPETSPAKIYGGY